MERLAYHDWYRKLRRHWIVYTLLLLVLAVGVFLRTYRSFDLLRFYYDQGRDALEVYNILAGDLTLIGPTTGFFGIFRGPFWYYWLIPGYVIGNGNPGIAATYISTVNALGIGVIFFCGSLFFNKKTGLIAALLTAFSYHAVVSARWLSNPSPVWLFCPLAFLGIMLGLRKTWWYMPIGLFCLGITLQLEEAGMGFVVIGVFIWLLFYLKKLSVWQWFISWGAFIIPFLPLAIFDLRNNFLITSNVLKLIFGKDGDASFAVTSDTLTKLIGFHENFTSHILVDGKISSLLSIGTLIGILLLIGFLAACVTYRKNPAFQLALVWVFVPLIFLAFYQKPVYGYYLLGSYPIFFLLTAVAINKLLERRYGWVFWSIPLMIVLSNLPVLRGYLTSHVEVNTQTVHLENQAKAIAYMVNNAEGQPISYAVYVPPQIPYTYTYLIPWYQKYYKTNTILVDPNHAIYHFTIEEVDQEHPGLAFEWRKKQDMIGPVIDQFKLGGVSVQKRRVVK